MSIVRSCRRAAVDRLGQAVLVDAELRRAVAAVGEARVIAGPGGRVHAQPDRPAGRPPADPFDLADRVEVEVDRQRQDRVEVALGQVRAGVADLLGRPAALDRALDLAGRAGVDPDERPEDLEDPRLRVGLEREAEPDVQPGGVERRGEATGVVGEAVEVVDEERRPVASRRGPRRPRRRSSGGRHAARDPAASTTARRRGPRTPGLSLDAGVRRPRRRMRVPGWSWACSREAS